MILQYIQLIQTWILTHHGVSRKMAEKLRLKEVKVLVPLEKQTFEACYIYS